MHRSSKIAIAALSIAAAWSSAARADEPPRAEPAAPAKSDSPAPAAAPADPASPAAQQSVKLTFESTQRSDRAAPDAPKRPASPDDAKLLHGFRLGYGMVLNYDKPVDALEGQSLKDRLGLRAPSHFLLGYEVMYRVVSQSWLNVLLLGNGMVAGLEQSKFLPSANLLIGAEINNAFQIGVGANLSPLKGQEAHTIIAAGWTPKVGTLYTPLHVFFIPDVDGVHHIGATTGVTF